MKNLFILFTIALISIACGGGGGGGGETATTATDSSSNFKFKSSDTATTTGTWYAVGYNLDGIEYMPTKAKEIKLVANSDGTWSMSLILVDTNGAESTFVVTSEGVSTDNFTITSFSYVAEERKITITESYIDKSTNQSHTVSTTFIKSGVPTEYVGTYDVTEIRFNSSVDVPSEFVYHNTTLSEDGTFVSKYRYIGDSTDSTTSVKIHVGGGKIFIQGLVSREIGNVSFNNGTLTYSTVWSSGDSSVNTYSQSATSVQTVSLSNLSFTSYNQKAGDIFTYADTYNFVYSNGTTADLSYVNQETYVASTTVPSKYFYSGNIAGPYVLRTVTLDGTVSRYAYRSSNNDTVIADELNYFTTDDQTTSTGTNKLVNISTNDTFNYSESANRYKDTTGAYLGTESSTITLTVGTGSKITVSSGTFDAVEIKYVLHQNTTLNGFSDTTDFTGSMWYDITKGILVRMDISGSISLTAQGLTATAKISSKLTSYNAPSLSKPSVLGASDSSKFASGVLPPKNIIINDILNHFSKEKH